MKKFLLGKYAYWINLLFIIFPVAFEWFHNYNSCREWYQILYMFITCGPVAFFVVRDKDVYKNGRIYKYRRESRYFNLIVLFTVSNIIKALFDFYYYQEDHVLTSISVNAICVLLSLPVSITRSSYSKELDKIEIIQRKRIFFLTYILFLFIILSSCSDSVYVCMGSYSRRYHKTESCKGLRRCGGKIEKVSKEKADSMFRTPCHICYSIKERSEH